MTRFMILRSQYLGYARVTLLTLFLWFGVPPIISEVEQSPEHTESTKPQHPPQQRNIVHVPAKFQILDMYFDSLLEHSLDDIEEHSATVPEETPKTESEDRDL